MWIDLGNNIHSWISGIFFTFCQVYFIKLHLGVCSHNFHQTTITVIAQNILMRQHTNFWTFWNQPFKIDKGIFKPKCFFPLGRVQVSNWPWPETVNRKIFPAIRFWFGNQLSGKFMQQTSNCTAPQNILFTIYKSKHCSIICMGRELRPFQWSFTFQWACCWEIVTAQ